MTWEQALTEIESHQFDANLSVVSGMRAFYRAAANEPACMELYSNMLASGDAREEVLGHILDMSQLEVDKRFENPNDTPLAILLWLTGYAAPDFVELAADVVDRAPQCWYAKKLARRILVPPPVASGDTWASGHIEPTDRRYQLVGDITLTLNPISKGVRRFQHHKPKQSALRTGNVGESETVASVTAADLTIG